MSTITITCPSGLVGELRKLKTKELNLMATAKERKADATDALLAGVWTQTLDLGPAYGDDFTWPKALLGDRLFAMIQARVHTFGADFDFRMTCKACREAYEWTIDLNDLPVRTLKAEDAATFKAGNTFHDVVDNVGFTFTLMTGDSEKRSRAVLKSNRTAPMTAGLLARVRSVDGVGEVGRKAFFEDLDFDTVNNMRLAMEAHDCGVETMFDTVCSECRALNEVQLPFGETSFWLPKKATSTRT